jgi:guanylate kinase
VLIAIAGPSGAGKSYFVDNAVASGVARRLVPTTTRKPRVDEVDGRDFEFISKRDFQYRLRSGWFYDWDYTVGNYYGYGPTLADHAESEDCSVAPVVARMAVRLRQRTSRVWLLFLDERDEILDGRNSSRRYDLEESILRRLHRDEEREHSVLFDRCRMGSDLTEEAIRELVRLAKADVSRRR